MGAAGSCGKNEDNTEIVEIDPSLEAVSAGNAESYLKNEIREIDVTESFSILVSHVHGTFYAYGSKCPHYGGPLAKGSVFSGIVKCPWHGASFDIRTGDIEDAPGFQCIPVYPVIRDKKGEITVYPSNYDKYSVERPICRRTNTEKVFVAIGSGPAAVFWAQTLRENGFEGRLVLVSRDEYMPYDRTKLSKTPGITYGEIKLKPEQWFLDGDVEVMLKTSVTHVNFKTKKVYVRNNSKTLRFDKLLIASGCRPRMPLEREPGMDSGGVIGLRLKNIFTLHSLRDAAKIKEATKGKHVVIMGSGFIAMELASNLIRNCKRITVIMRSKRPYGIVLGATVGRALQRRLMMHGRITFYNFDDIVAIGGDENGAVKWVETMKKKVIKCGVVIYAIGAVPNSDVVGEGLPLEILSNGYIPVNEQMQTNLEDIYAVGDVTRFPLDCAVNRVANVAHWGIAQKTGKIAALNMIGIPATINQTVPFFWTNIAGCSIRYAGYGENYDESIIFGELDDMVWCVLYRRGGKVIACCTCNCDPIAARISFDIQHNVEHGFYKFPKYVRKMFKLKPILGDTNVGLKFNHSEVIHEWDIQRERYTKLWTYRRRKEFQRNRYEPKFYEMPDVDMDLKKVRFILGGRQTELGVHKIFADNSRRYLTPTPFYPRPPPGPDLYMYDPVDEQPPSPESSPVRPRSPEEVPLPPHPPPKPILKQISAYRNDEFFEPLMVPFKSVRKKKRSPPKIKVERLDKKNVTIQIVPEVRRFNKYNW